ncbi:DUF2829 domain-containing protein [Lacticaseibacillus baoqingensis]|uniref:DUF2829 domain-containing protein n=1 Tax=Lacticaseibacillus baoqingensis TaxID=2486013 RepID=A0ABW4E5R6_9LACO|nr:DUF2829 domain-containing protein [Lacticaseibacillus baoqingensis]
MTFEAILPQLKAGAKAVRSGWGGGEEYITLVDHQNYEGIPVTPYFLIKVQGEGFSVWEPTGCDALATDWQPV